MKTLISILIGLLVVGCGKTREITSEEKKLVGTYEFIADDGVSSKYVLLKNGTVEWYLNGEKRKGDINWKIGRDGTLQFLLEGGAIAIYVINKDSSLTSIRLIKPNGKPSPHKFNNTYKKIK